MEINHLRAKHVTKLAHDLLVPSVVLQADFRLNLHMQTGTQYIRLTNKFSSVQFSKNISIAQLSRMSHCTPEATLNPICLLKFTPETVVRNVFVAQVCWQAVPDMWPGNSKAPEVAYRVVRSVRWCTILLESPSVY